MGKIAGVKMERIELGLLMDIEGGVRGVGARKEGAIADVAGGLAVGLLMLGELGALFMPKIT